jgi:amino acid adenylation domain-containing protein/non-ribosomal peptide synthase protein (TIGR01720 family)
MEEDIVEGFRLSPQQKRLWLLQHADSPLPYQTTCVVSILGPVKANLLERAIRTLIARHEILRTSISLLPGLSIPVQVISDDSTFSLAQCDVTALDGDDQRTRMESLVKELQGRGIDWEQLPRVRADLIALSRDEFRLVLRMNALSADGPSLHRLIGQTAAAYAALAAGADTPTTEAMQYADFAEWKHQVIAGEPAQSRAYWKQFALDDVAGQTLPIEIPKGGLSNGFRLASVPVDIPVRAAEQIATMAAARGLSVSSFVLACWQTLLWRLTERPDVVVGAAFNGRNFPDLDASIGLFSTYLPIRATPADDRTLAEMWTHVTDREREAHQWQEYFVWDGLGFFPFCFEVRTPVASWSAAGLLFSMEREQTCIDRFKVKLVCDVAAAALSAELQFDQSALSNENARRLAEQLSTLIEDASCRPQSTLNELNLLSDGERRRLAVFNDAQREYPPGLCVHDLFEEHAARTPNATAVVYETDHLTYGALNARANQLAHYLIKAGVGADVPVAICVERSVSLIVGVLGILKAGGAYVPLDPSLPKSRLRAMLEDAGAHVLVSNAAFAEGFVAPVRARVRLDADVEALNAESCAQPPRRVSDQNLVYVIFTSGSTGRPKGVAVEHRQLVNYIQAVSDTLGLAGRSFAMVSTIAADLGNTAIFPALATGGTLHVISELRAADPARLGEYFAQHAVECLKIVPSHLTALLSGAHPAHVIPSHRLVLGGDICPWSLIRTIEALTPGTGLVNHYGPTEATVGALTYHIDGSESDQTTGAVPLGRPLGNMRAHILDRQFRPTPIGVAGELHIGGRGVARGYINRPDLTAEKFVANPFSDEPGGRLYKTGDRARYWPDGRIEFLGRIDDQVKIRGYRVEPAEIEVALRGHAAVASCVVVARQDEPGDIKLVAYLVSVDRQTAGVDDLRSFLKDRLPEYMIPSAFVFLDRLPLSPNGKVDRRALPVPDYAPATRERRLVGPRTEAEAILARIWSAVLGIDRIGVDDNFFELGGDSILSIQIIARAAQSGLRLSPRQVFQHQTIAELAAAAVVSQAATAVPQDVVTGEVPLTPVQARFFETDPPEPHHYNQAMLLELHATVDVSLLERALGHLLRHHDALRLRAVQTEEGWRQRIDPPDNAIPFESIDLSRAAHTDQAEALASHTARLHASLNLQEGPIVRVARFDFGAGRHPYLLFVIHHLAVDTVSWGILLEDFETAVRQLGRGEAPVLPPKTTSFKTWAERITEHARSTALQGELSHWLRSEPVARLPVDYPGGDNTAASARTVTVSLSAAETSALLQEVPSAYRTQINEVLLTALTRALAPWAGSTLLVDLEGHGREEIIDGFDLSRTVGWFTTIFPVWLTGGDTPSPADTLRSVKERLRAIPQRGIGYGLLRYGSGSPIIGDRLRSLPQAQVRLNYLGQANRLLLDSSLFRVAPASVGPSQSSRFPRTYLLNIIGQVADEQLHLEWTYSCRVHAPQTVERLGQNCLDQLRVLIAERHSLSTGSLTPSDFPTAGLTQEALDKVLTRLKESQKSR